jgi:hypothetical protein
VKTGVAMVRRSVPFALAAIAEDGGIDMAKEHADVLRSARGRLVDSRRELAIALAKPFARADTEQWRKNMIEVQATLHAIDEALKDEEALAST